MSDEPTAEELAKRAQVFHLAVAGGVVLALGGALVAWKTRYKKTGMAALVGAALLEGGLAISRAGLFLGPTDASGVAHPDITLSKDFRVIWPWQT